MKIKTLFRTTAALGGFGLAAVALHFGLVLVQRESVAAPAPAAAPVATNQLRYPSGSPQLAFLSIRAASLTPLPALEPVPARLAYDENRTVRVFSPLAGRTVRILAQPGDRVKPGQVLAWIDSPDYGTALADQRKAQADDEAKQSALRRAQRLYEAGVIAARDLESARADAKTSQAELGRSASHLRGLGAGNDDGHYAVRAPIAGVVAERHLNPGQEVRPDAPDPLFVITDPQQLDVVADLTEADVAHLHGGQQVLIDAGNESGGAVFEPVRAQISSIGVGVDAATRRVPVRAKLLNTPPGARAELFVRFTPIDERSPGVIVVPNGAIVTSGVQSFVFVETEPGVLVKRAVQFALRGRDVSYVREGVKAGERIVTQGALLVDADLTSGS